MYNKIKIGIISLSVMLVLGCSTEKNTAIRRTYHNVTSRYNVLFNGKESYKEGVKKYNEAFQDDYSRIIPVFTYGNTSNSEAIKPQMERAIEKASKLVDKHSITAKPDVKKGSLSEKEQEFLKKSEYNKYVDDAYLLMAKAYFWEKDYQNAERTFLYILSKYDDEEILFFTYIWLARTYSETKSYGDFMDIMRNIEEDKIIEKKKIHYKATFADYFIKQQRYEEALPYMEECVELARKKADKIRYNFILAQLYDELGKNKQAYESYEKVVKLNPDYEINFNARIKQASLAGSFGGGEKSLLLKMIKDDKNIDYLDQIYFALGKISINENNMPQAIDYFHQSVRSSVNNDNQKGLSYLTLADIYYDQKNYVSAQAYYDSTVTTLNNEYPGYTEIYMLNKNLSKLVVNIQQYELQDSLQRLALMDEKERNNLIQDYIARVVEEERRERERQQELRESTMMIASSNTRYNSQYGDGGKWYFYSPSAKSFGEPEFKRKWGTRKLEDNWRRGNKNVLNFDMADDTELGNEDDQTTGPINKKSKEYYLKDLPLTDSLMGVSNTKMEKALFNMASIYQNDFEDNAKAIDAYLTLLERFPETEYKVAAYYYLSQLYQAEGDQSNADIYKNKVLRNHPETVYAKILTNPDYYKEHEKKENAKLELYSGILNKYNDKLYAQVITESQEGLRLYPDSELSPKLAFLIAMSKGRLYGTSALMSELEAVAKVYKGDTIALRAEEIISFLQENELKSIQEFTSKAKQEVIVSEQVVVQDKPVAVSTQQKYHFNTEAKYYFALAVDKDVDINQLKFNVINFNLDYYLQKDYVAEEKTLNEFLKVISVKRFETLDEAMDYYLTFEAKEERVMGDYMQKSHQFFIISVENYITLFNEALVRDYLEYFKNTHLK